MAFPCAIQLVHLDGKDKITTDTKLLQKFLLDPAIKEKQVCVISITGIFRQGKSFLLNFLLRYLNLKYKQKRNIGEKWLIPDDGNLAGFEWKCGKERHTIGILMWSEIFIAELPSGEEIAVILLDTQGTFDNKTTKQHCAAVFAISTLISSVQIYNIMKQIDQAHLDHMECFSGYGQMAQNSTRAPFQDVCFLIRDWQCPYDNPYGASGGQEYLMDFLEDPDQPDQIKKQNANIRKLYENRKCFLLPYPGQKVATGRDFRGELKDIDRDFLHFVEELAPFLLAPENLIPKKINGEKIKVGDLVHFIQSYCTYFMSNEVPKLESMYMATAMAHFNAFIQEAVMYYKQKMDPVINEKSPALEEPVLIQGHEKIKQELLHFLNTKNIIGKEDMRDEYEAKLRQTVDELFSEYKKLNKTKLEMEKEIKKFNELLKLKLDELNKFEELVKAQQKEIKESEEKRKELTKDIDHLKEKITMVENRKKDLFGNFEMPWLKLGLSLTKGILDSVFGMIQKKKQNQQPVICCPIPVCPPNPCRR